MGEERREVADVEVGDQRRGRERQDIYRGNNSIIKTEQ